MKNAVKRIAVLLLACATLFGLVACALTPEETGIATGVVHTVTVKEGTNDVQRVAVIGGTASGGERYFKPEAGGWTYLIPAHSADRMLEEHNKTE